MGILGIVVAPKVTAEQTILAAFCRAALLLELILVTYRIAKSLAIKLEARTAVECPEAVKQVVAHLASGRLEASVALYGRWQQGFHLNMASVLNIEYYNLKFII